MHLWGAGGLGPTTHPWYKYIMRSTRMLIATVVSAGFCLLCNGLAEEALDLRALSVNELEHRLADIDSELDQLARYTPRNGIAALGLRSKRYTTPDTTIWISIELGEALPIDQVVLLPVLSRDAESGLYAERFPRTFRIHAGTDQSTNVVAAVTEEDQLLPRTAPVVVPFQEVTASWVAIEVTTLSSHPFHLLYRLQLSEIMVFSGMENVALHKQALVSPLSMNGKDAKHRRFLTDGSGPYLMDAARGALLQTREIHVEAPDPPPTLTIDLTSPVPVNQINLHAVYASRSVPANQFDCWAMPRHIRIMGANQADFSDQTLLGESEQSSIYDHTPIIMRRFPETLCRYIRLEILDTQPVASMVRAPSTIAFSEIEVLSRGRNVAIGAPVTLSPGLSAIDETRRQLTDGHNYFGEILPLRDWMNQLARRHDLEIQRPLVVEALQAQYARQQAILLNMQWLAAWLVTCIIFIVLIDRNLRQRAIQRTRERIAANLHDELGANLHAIGLFGDLAKQEARQAEGDNRWNALVQHVDEIRTLTEHAGKTARYCTNMLAAKDVYTNLADDMKRTAEHLGTDLEHDLSFENEEKLQSLSARQSIDLLLFYRECITNINRHAHATHLETRLTADSKALFLTIQDNGQGVETTPPSLKRRARMLKGKLAVETPAEGGTCVTLKLRLRSLRSWGRGLRSETKGSSLL